MPEPVLSELFSLRFRYACEALPFGLAGFEPYSMVWLSSGFSRKSAIFSVVSVRVSDAFATISA
jgi:hypothetical protein